MNRFYLRLALGALCVVGGASFFLLGKSSSSSPAAVAYERGKSLADARQTADAVAAYQEAIGLDPRFAPPYRALAEIASNQDDLETAIARWQEYLAREPKAQHAWCRLAGAWMRAHKETEALHAALQELKPAPDCGRAHLIAGEIYERSSQVRQALEHLAAAARTYPNEPRIQLVYGRVLARSGDLDHAEPILRDVVAKDPSHAEGFRWLGSVYARRSARPGNAGRAEQNLRRAIELKPDYAEAHCELAQILFAQHRAAAALPYVKKANAFRKHYSHALYLQAQIDDALGRRAEAEKMHKEFHREKALSERLEALLARYRQDRQNIGNAVELARILVARDLPEQAVAILRKVAVYAPDDARVKAALAQAEALSGSSLDSPLLQSGPEK